MASVVKYTKGQIGGLTRHFERAKDKESGEYIRFSNQEINLSKTYQNYNLAPHKTSQLEFIKKRCNEVYCLNRKDVNVMATWVITKPLTLRNEDEKKFFQETYNFLANRYGEKNVISAYVHKDETTPHMHFSFVPVGFDKKNNRETVSAKIVLNKNDLKTFHSDLDNCMTKIFSRDIGILNEATKEGNKSIVELKRKSATERLNEIKEIAKQNIHKSEKIFKQAQEELSSIECDILVYQDELKRLQEQVNTYNGILKSFYEVDNIGKKSLTGKITMTVGEAKKLKEQAKAYFSANSKVIDLVNKNNRISKNCTHLNNKCVEFKNELNKKNNSLNLLMDVIKSNSKLHNDFKQQYKIFTKNQIQIQEKESVQKQLNKKLKKQNKSYDDFR